MNPDPDPASAPYDIAEDWKPTIFVAHCPFKKNGAPSLGTFGQSIDEVVVMRLSTWNRLCQDIPELGRQQFNVGHDE